jgi:hypothetical protein
MHLKNLWSFWGMATKDPFGDPINVTPESMRTFAAALRAIADRHVALAEWMEKDEIPGVRAKNLKSAAGALAQLGKFVGAITTSACDHLSADGLSQLEGGIALLTRYLKRTSTSLQASMDDEDASEIAADTAGVVQEVRTEQNAQKKPRVKK